MRIAVITASITPCDRPRCTRRCDDRPRLIEEAKASVETQTLAPVVHLVETTVCSAVEGAESAVRNRLIAQARDEYGGDGVAFLDDDDILDAHHLAVLASVVAAEPGIVMAHSRCRVTVDGVQVPDAKLWREREWNAEAIQRHNWIPVTVLLRVSAWEEHGPFEAVRNEEWKLWKKLGLAGCEVGSTDVVTWTYRNPGWMRPRRERRLVG